MDVSATAKEKDKLAMSRSARQMRRHWAGLLALAVALVQPGDAVAQWIGQAASPLPTYPATRRGGQVDELGGMTVADPFRWLEDPGSAEVARWIAAENAVTDTILNRVAGRADIRARVERLWNYAKVRPPFSAGDRTFMPENDGLENQAVLWVRDARNGIPRLLLDGDLFAQDGSVAIAALAPSPDGRYLAYGVSKHGSQWREFRVRDVRTRQDLSDTVRGIAQSSVSWTRDERGFFYVRTDREGGGGMAGVPATLAPSRPQRVFYHRIGQRQSQDQTIFERAEHFDWRYGVVVSEDGQYAVITIASGAGMGEPSRVYFIDLDNPKRPNVGAPVVRLFDAADAMYEFISSRGSLFYLRTNRAAPRGRVVAVDINAPSESRWQTIVGESYDPLVEAVRVDDRIIAHRLRDAHSVLELYDLGGTARGSIPLPGIGTVGEFTSDANERAAYFAFSSFLIPPLVLRYDFETRTVVRYREPRAATDLGDYETTQIFFNSKDGARVPIFVTARRGLVRDGSHPTLLVADGGFDRAMTPHFSPAVAAWLEIGGVYAVASVRGGGEYGRAWRVSGAGPQKQNAFDDFAGAAEFLISQRYTRPSALAIAGRGNGGLAVGAVLTQHPELVGAALIDGGLLDLVRFNRFTFGWMWTPEYGSPVDGNQLRTLLAYSPLHNVRNGTRYPATFITTGERDDGIPPLHALKFAAAMQGAQAGSAPILLRVEGDAGELDLMPTLRRVALDADRLTFLAAALGLAR
jgi:prolyl oligopeptidase